MITWCWFKPELSESLNDLHSINLLSSLSNLLNYIAFFQGEDTVNAFDKSLLILILYFKSQEA